MHYLLKNIVDLEERIVLACQKYGRLREEIEVVFVSKKVDVAKVVYLNQQGYSYFGESRAQEGLAKYNTFLNSLDDNYQKLKEQNSNLPSKTSEIPRFTFIGHLQSNKVNTVLKFTNLIQSIDRYSIALELEKKLVQQKRFLDILIQVNTSAETNKSGVSPEKALDLIAEIKDNCSHLQIKGLMTIAHLDLQEQKTHYNFQLLSKIQTESKNQFSDLTCDILSMGMSRDLEIAIAEGSTMLRIGRDVFGEREVR